MEDTIGDGGGSEEDEFFSAMIMPIETRGLLCDSEKLIWVFVFVLERSGNMPGARK
jgi:hypothetical protein